MESTQLPPQPQTERPRLERPRHDRAVAGVASGLARYLNVDVAWIRIAFVVMTLFGGTGILLYLIGWIAMPEEGERDSIVSSRSHRFENLGSWIGVGLIVLAAMIIIGNTGLIDGDLVFAGVLIVIGFLLYRGDIRLPRNENDQMSDAGRVEPATYAPVVDGSPPVVDSEPVVEDTVAYEREEPIPAAPLTPPAPPPPPDPAFQPRPPRPRESSVLGRLAVATAFIAVGVMGVGHSTGWWEPAIRHYVGAIFVILGAALVIGAVFGRARWLIVVGLISAPMLLGAALLDVPLEGGFGDPLFEPSSSEQLEPEYRLIGGELELDLTDFELGRDEVHEIDASVVFGSLQIRFPEGMGVVINAELDAGDMRFDGERIGEGVGVDRSRTYEGDGKIIINAHVGFGELVVDRIEVSP